MSKIGRIAIAAVAAVALFLAAGIAVRRGGEDAARGTGEGATSAGALVAPAAAAGSLEGTITALQARLRQVPDDWRSFASLGLAYVQEARITADPSFYPKAQGVLERSLALRTDDNFEAMVGMASLAAARHAFTEALDWGERAEAINPYNASVYGVIGDAQTELGRYDDALTTFQEMVDLRPDLASYARVSYVRELHGDVDGAIAAMRGAETFASSPVDQAWAANQLGELYFNSGRLGPAQRAYRAATRLAPTFVPPVAGLAKVAWARGDLDAAIRGFTDVTQRYPTPEYVVALGELYQRAGDPEAAQRQFDLVGAIHHLFTSNGVNVDLELALYNADHADPAAALATARAEWDRRHAVTVADALAWSLYANGDYREAARYADRALRLGTPNALFLFHAGMIRVQLGDDAAAQRFLSAAIDTNPNFSIRYAPLAARTLASLGRAS